MKGVEPSVMRAIRRGERAAGRAVVGLLRKRFGWLATARVLAAVAIGKLRGEPFATLAAPRDVRERLSRRQCGDVVLIARAVTALAGREAAVEVARTTMLAAALPFIEAMVPAGSAAGLAEQAPKIAGNFFNAEGRGRRDGDAYLFDVSRCHFVELLQAVGESDLAPLFCEVDEHFFDGRQRPVVLRRSGTLARGADHCDFRFEPVDE